MPIPAGTKFQGIPADQDYLNNKRSTQSNETAPVYDISEFGGGGSELAVVNKDAQGVDENTTTILEYNSINVIQTSDINNFCCKLPEGETGKSLIIVNRTATDINVFPPDSGSTINTSPGLPAVIPPDNKPFTFYCIDNPVPSIWTISTPATNAFSFDFEVPHTQGTPTNGWIGSSGFQSGFTPGSNYNYPLYPYQTGSIYWSNNATASDFLVGPSPLTLTKLTLFSNIRNEMSLGSNGCTTGACNSYGLPNDYPENNPVGNEIYQSGPVIQWNYIHKTLEANGESTGGSATTLQDSTVDFTTILNGSAPFTNTQSGVPTVGAAIIQYGSPTFGSQYLQGAAIITNVTTNEITFEQVPNSFTFGTVDFSPQAGVSPSKYKIIQNNWGDRTAFVPNYFYPAICCTWANSFPRSTATPNGQIAMGSQMRIAGDNNIPAPAYNGLPGDSGTQYIEFIANYTPNPTYPSLPLGATGQVGSAPPAGTSLVTGDTYNSFTIYIPPYMATKTYKFTAVFEGF